MTRSFLAFGTAGTLFDPAVPRPARAAPAARPHLVIEGVTRAPRRREAAPAIEWLDLAVARGEIASLLTDAAVGTAALDLVAGFAAPDRGRIALDGADLLRLPPAARGLGLVPRPLALFPALSALGNAALPLEARGVPRREREARAAEALDRFGLAAPHGARPGALPPADALAVALARATAHAPSLLLLDDPLAAFPDAPRRADALRRVLRGLGLTILHATADPALAFALSDRVAVMAGGRVRQTGTPRALYDAPADAVVAAMTGEANLLPGRVSARDEDGLAVRLDGGLEAVGHPVGPLEPGARALLLIRPEHVAVAALSAEEMGEDAVPATLVDATVVAGDARLTLRLADGTELVSRRPAGLPMPTLGGTAAVAWNPGAARVFPA